MSIKIVSYEDLNPLGVRLSKSQLRRLEAAGKFPRRVRLSGHKYGWIAGELEAYLKQCVAERDAA